MWYKFEYEGFALIEAENETEAREKYEFEESTYAGKQLRGVQALTEEEATAFMRADILGVFGEDDGDA